MAKQETEILSFSYPTELKEELQEMAEKDGYKLATYVKRIISIFLEDENDEVEEKSIKKSKKKRRKK